MAQEKLLFYVALMFVFAFSLNADANARVAEKVMEKETYKYRAADMEFAEDLAKSSRQTGMRAIKEKWLELQQMLQKKQLRQNHNKDKSVTDQAFSTDGLSTNNTLRVFVFASMGRELLKNYVAQARHYGVTIVFNGLPDGSWRKLSDLIYEITGDKAASIQLDDMAFTEYSIKSVPAFVLSREESVFNEIDIDDADANSQNRFDKVVGNIGIRRALEEIAAKGDLAYEASILLDEARGYR